jgi:DNA-directed RNA polymerase subunit RPC12/RpoP
MKASEIIKKELIPEDDCEVCTLHDIARDMLRETMQCPHCGKHVSVDKIEYNGEFNIVGETNYYSENQNIENMLTIECPHCNMFIGFKPIPLIYNGNHDIYYTGGKDYLVTDKIQLTEDIKKSIEQYTDRIKAGENLSAWNLETWIEYGVEHMIAEILFKHGLKY